MNASNQFWFFELKNGYETDCITQGDSKNFRTVKFSGFRNFFLFFERKTQKNFQCRRVWRRISLGRSIAMQYRKALYSLFSFSLSLPSALSSSSFKKRQKSFWTLGRKGSEIKFGGGSILAAMNLQSNQIFSNYFQNRLKFLQTRIKWFPVKFQLFPSTHKRLYFSLNNMDSPLRDASTYFLCIVVFAASARSNSAWNWLHRKWKISFFLFSPGIFSCAADWTPQTLQPLNLNNPQDLKGK